MSDTSDSPKKDFEITIEDVWIRIRVRAGTVITADLIFSMLKQVYSMKAYQAEKPAGLWDFRGCTSDINFEKMTKIKDFITANYNPNWSHYISAFVVDSESNYGLSRMYELMSEDIPTRLGLFKDMDRAESWILEEISQGIRRNRE